MPIVEALCLNDAWDSVNCFYYEKGRTYSIDTDSEIARMVARPLLSGKMNKDGEIVAAKIARPPLPCFQFDRAAPLGAVGNGKPSDYTCKKCGATKDPQGRPFTLNSLGTHTRSTHNEAEAVDDDAKGDASAEESVVRQVSTCKQCDPPQVFASRGEMMKHKGEVHGASFFKKVDKQEVEAEAIPA